MSLATFTRGQEASADFSSLRAGRVNHLWHFQACRTLVADELLLVGKGALLRIRIVHMCCASHGRGVWLRLPVRFHVLVAGRVIGLI